MDLLIDKKYLVRLERYTKFGGHGYMDPWACRYVFRLPERAGLPEGYTVYIDTHQIEWSRNEDGNVSFSSSVPLYSTELENNCTYRLQRDDDEIYVATMTENREAGKKYRRYKFTSEELYALYQDVDLNVSKLAVASVDIYFEYSEGIASTNVLIGKVQDSWFYCSELRTKRRIKSRGVRILGYIECASQEAVQLLINEYEKGLSSITNKYFAFDRGKVHIQNILRELRLGDEYFRDSKDAQIIDTVSYIRSQAELAVQLLEQKGTMKADEKASLELDFNKKLKKYFIKDKN